MRRCHVIQLEYVLGQSAHLGMNNSETKVSQQGLPGMII